MAASSLTEAAALAAECDALLHGVPGVQALLGRRELLGAIGSRLDQLEARIAAADEQLERAEGLGPDDLERLGAEVIALRDASWAVRRDRMRTVAAVDDLAGRDGGAAAIAGYLAVQQALSALDRLEVRGRDSAGLHLYVWHHGLSADDPAVAALLAQRSADPLFQSGSVRHVGTCLSFVYKAAAEIGELGDNTRALRTAIRSDELLRLALAAPTARVAVLGHTRRASVGIISEPNCHPLNSEELGLDAG